MSGVGEKQILKEMTNSKRQITKNTTFGRICAAFSFVLVFNANLKSLHSSLLIESQYTLELMIDFYL